MRPFLIAIRFLTILPAPLGWEPTLAERGKAVAWYPFAGLLIGLLVTGVAWVGVDSSMVVGAALGVAVWATMTGALHLDGMGDCADGVMGGLGDRERTLAIMKDPYFGVAGVTAVVVILMIKFGGTHDVAGHGQWAALALIPALARTIPWLLFASTPYIASGVMGAGIDRHLTPGSMWGSLLLYLVTVLIVGLHGLVILLVLFAVVWGVRSMALSRLGGINGDVIGAAIELAEAASVVVIAFIV